MELGLVTRHNPVDLNKLDATLLVEWRLKKADQTRNIVPRKDRHFTHSAYKEPYVRWVVSNVTRQSLYGAF